MPDEKRIAERVNLRYSPATDGQRDQGEIPFRLLVVGDFTGGQNPARLKAREPLNINNDNFESRLEAQNLSLNLSVPNRLRTDDVDARLAVNLNIRNMKDFTPDRVVEQVEPLRQLRDLRVALEKLKQQYINEEDFRTALRAILKDPDKTRRVLEQLKMQSDEP